MRRAWVDIGIGACTPSPKTYDHGKDNLVGKLSVKSLVNAKDTGTLLSLSCRASRFENTYLIKFKAHTNFQAFWNNSANFKVITRPESREPS